MLDTWCGLFCAVCTTSLRVNKELSIQWQHGTRRFRKLEFVYNKFSEKKKKRKETHVARFS